MFVSSPGGKQGGRGKHSISTSLATHWTGSHLHKKIIKNTSMCSMESFIVRSLQKVFFSHYRGKDNLTSNMMGEVMRQVLRPGNRKKAHQSLFPLFWKGWLDDHIFVYFSGFWTGWHSDHSLQFSFIWKISQWILPRTGYKHQKLFGDITRNFYL